jgi:hypothetical protein
MVCQSYREHLDKGIVEMRPTSHPYALYLSSRVESFHNRRHRSLSVGGASLSRERTSFWNGHKMFVAWTMQPIIPQRTLHGQLCMQKTLSRRFPQGDNISQTISFASQSNSTKSLYIGIEHIKSLPMAIGILKTKCEVHPPSNRRAVMSK